MLSNKFRIIITLSFAIFFIAAFYILLLQPLWDYDFWWHIASGRYIVTEGHLPAADPFSYTSTLEVNKNVFPEREQFILKQYWLAQVIFYLIFDTLGAGGIIFIRSLLLLLLVVTVFWALKRTGVKYYLIFIFVFLLWMESLTSSGERPVLFSMFFTALTLFLLEEFRERKGISVVLIAPIMLLWANMHGGFILGVVIIFCYMLSETLKSVFGKSNLSHKERVIFFFSTIAAILISLLNPTSWDAFSVALHPRYNIFLEGIQEYASPFWAYKNKVRSPDYAYLALVLLFPVMLIVRNRKVDPAHLILLSGFLLMSLKSLRYGFFYSIIASMLLGKQTDYAIRDLLESRLRSETYRKVEKGFFILMLISTLLFIAGVLRGKPSLDIARRFSVPDKAVDFIEKNSLRGNMFNDFGYGGYLSWRLYPEKTFIDSRSLNKIVMNEYGWIADAVKKVQGIRTRDEQSPLWEVLLRHYKINYIFLSLSDMYGTVPPLIVELMGRSEWVPVYMDTLSMILIKDLPANREIIAKYKLDDSLVSDALIYKHASATVSARRNPRSLISLGIIFSKIGRHEDALKAYRLAAERWDDPELMKTIRELDAELSARGSAETGSPIDGGKKMNQ